jgi:hypothetical protein
LINDLAKTRPHLLLCVDEIDAFSKEQSSQKLFIDLLKTILAKPKQSSTSQIQSIQRKIVASKKPLFADRHMFVTVVGIANSVELFQGEILSATDSQIKKKKKFICHNEKKLLFEPYTRD